MAFDSEDRFSFVTNRIAVLSLIGYAIFFETFIFFMGCIYILSLYLFPISFIGFILGLFYGKETLVYIMGTICFVSMAIINYVKVPYMIGMYKAKREDNSIKWRYVFGLSYVSMLYGIICPVLFVALFVISIIYSGLTWMHIVALLLLGIWIYSIWRNVE